MRRPETTLPIHVQGHILARAGPSSVRRPDAVTREKLAILRQADAIFLVEIRKTGLYDRIWQAVAVPLPVRMVGVMGDQPALRRSRRIRDAFDRPRRP
jgi:GMP synthase PP-ATPase subunit